MFIKFLAGKLFYEIKDYENSINFLEKVLNDENYCNAGTEYNALIILSKVARGLEKFNPEVFALLSKYVKDYRSEELYISLGYQLIYSKVYDEAIKFFERVSGEEGFIGKARASIEKGDYKKAIESYIKYFEIADCLNEKYLKVKEAFIKQTFYYANKLYEAKNYKEALYYYGLLSKTFPDEPQSDFAMLKCGLILAESKEYNRAIDFLKSVLKNNFTNCDEEALYNLGILYYSVNQKQKSFEIFTSFVRNYPGSSRKNEAEEWINLIKKEF